MDTDPRSDGGDNDTGNDTGPRQDEHDDDIARGGGGNEDHTIPPPHSRDDDEEVAASFAPVPVTTRATQSMQATSSAPPSPSLSPSPLSASTDDGLVATSTATNSSNDSSDTNEGTSPTISATPPTSTESTASGAAHDKSSRRQRSWQHPPFSSARHARASADAAIVNSEKQTTEAADQLPPKLDARHHSMLVQSVSASDAVRASGFKGETLAHEGESLQHRHGQISKTMATEATSRVSASEDGCYSQREYDTTQMMMMAVHAPTNAPVEHEGGDGPELFDGDGFDMDHPAATGASTRFVDSSTQDATTETHTETQTETQTRTLSLETSSENGNGSNYLLGSSAGSPTATAAVAATAIATSTPPTGPSNTVESDDTGGLRATAILASSGMTADDIRATILREVQRYNQQMATPPAQVAVAEPISTPRNRTVEPIQTTDAGENKRSPIRQDQRQRKRIWIAAIAIFLVVVASVVIAIMLALVLPASNNGGNSAAAQSNPTATPQPTGIPTVSPSLRQSVPPSSQPTPDFPRMGAFTDMLRVLEPILQESPTSIQREVFRDPTSVPYITLDWLANGDNPYPSLLLAQGNAAATRHLLEYYAFVSLYYSMDGPNWFPQTNIMSDLDICEWTSGLTIVRCNADRHIVELGLSQRRLAGTIDQALYLLTDLEVLDLSWNNITGSISSHIGALDQLVTLRLHESNLSDEIPAEISNCTQLIELQMEKSNIEGTLPTTLGWLTNLRLLQLQDNRLNGIIPTEVGDMESLEIMRFGANNFTGSLPSQIGRLTALRRLSVPENNLTGEIPDEVGNAIALNHVDLTINSIKGRIPTKLENLTEVVSLELGSNDLTGPIPSELGLMISLQLVSLDTNSLTGTVPTELGQLTELVELWLQFNDLIGPLPSEVNQLTTLRIVATTFEQ